MKKIRLENASLVNCVEEAQQQQIVITCEGKPVALLIGIEDLDEEQLQLGTSARFWKLITKRRLQPLIDRDELERRAARIYEKAKHARTKRSTR
ncbi:MAG: hypothetical protein HY706_02975 [Candidatus Hydrogenedentes bacterium]|nr:hypothetical protein [Candidatus Hydrogenedentota bacterium]